MFENLIAKLSLELFCSKNTNKITPKLELENAELENAELENAELENAELGKINIPTVEIHKQEGYTIDSELNSVIQNPDLELGFGPIIEIDSNQIIVDFKAFEKYKMVYDNYKSFIDSIVYLTTPFKYGSSVFLSDFSISDNKLMLINEFQVVMHIDTDCIGLRSNKRVV